MTPSVTVHHEPLAESAAEVLAVAVRPVEGRPRTAGAALELGRSLGLDLETALERARATGDSAEVVDLPVTDPAAATSRLLLVGLGDGSPTAARRAGAAMARRGVGAAAIATDALAGLEPEPARAFVEGALLAAYRFRARGAGDEPRKAPVRSLQVHLAGRRSAALRAAVDLAGLTARTAHLARDLANTPAQLKDPAWLARQAEDRGRSAGLEVSVRDEKALASEGFGGLLAVGGGSARPPRLVEMSYAPPRSRRAPHVVLVGKGITFDSGGLSLKPRDAMIPMKTDMSGGGAVLAVLCALREAGVRARVTGLVAAAENMPGASAVRPQDVVTHYGGRTVEVLNTDAEGRLVLADALAYADARLEPDLVVDVATLTGAASQGLGRRHAALFSTDEGLAGGLLAAGERSGEQLWRMPLVEDYRAAMDSDVADLRNVSGDPLLSGGAITAALFLREFAGARAWAHLDIAGPARADRDEHEVTRGGTGFGARLLLRWLQDL